ncbi:spondin-2-like isoform X1 [Choristoneura fumiferana]|uniref:spondin-2-like isoform X1 n=1 Tax=Choristoneura fumiferana TaxID=7141 RepID=UPI003D153914
MYLKQCVQLLCACAMAVANKCDQTPPLAPKDSTPSFNEMFGITVQSKGEDAGQFYLPDQRYVISLYTKNMTRLFRWFMVTIEEPDVDSSSYDFDRHPGDVGNLKTLDSDRRSRYSERCLNSVENIDNSEKDRIEMHWLSPKFSDRMAEKVRIRAMVAENADLWYISPNLTVELAKDNQKPIDSPPALARETCKLCSEARYEVIFRGQWSRLTHPQNFPTKADNNEYSYMVGASHDYKFVLWKPDDKAGEGLKAAAETANTTILEEEILTAMRGNKPNSTRTLIRGRKMKHPDMFEPSQALFRVDPLHHLFSLVVAFKPSPDWFLGAHQFDLCGDDEWLNDFKLPLYPWDAGTMDGVSYVLPTKVTMPQDHVKRVALGSFERESPFYQINLNDLKPFGHLQINLLNVYPLEDSECSESDEDKVDEENTAANQEEEPEEPLVMESRTVCSFSDWSDWSPCLPDAECGPGSQYRTRIRMNLNPYYKFNKNSGSSNEVMCIGDPNSEDTEYKECYVDCY